MSGGCSTLSAPNDERRNLRHKNDDKSQKENEADVEKYVGFRLWDLRVPEPPIDFRSSDCANHCD